MDRGGGEEGEPLPPPLSTLPPIPSKGAAAPGSKAVRRKSEGFGPFQGKAPLARFFLGQGGLDSPCSSPLKSLSPRAHEWVPRRGLIKKKARESLTPHSRCQIDGCPRIGQKCGSHEDVSFCEEGGEPPP